MFQFVKILLILCVGGQLEISMDISVISKPLQN